MVLLAPFAALPISAIRYIAHCYEVLARLWKTTLTWAVVWWRVTSHRYACPHSRNQSQLWRDSLFGLTWNGFLASHRPLMCSQQKTPDWVSSYCLKWRPPCNAVYQNILLWIQLQTQQLEKSNRWIRLMRLFQGTFRNLSRSPYS